MDRSLSQILETCEAGKWGAEGMRESKPAAKEPVDFEDHLSSPACECEDRWGSRARY